jgi:putative GTP pyrophosphokinase
MIDIENKINEFKRYLDIELEYYKSALTFFIELIAALPRVESISGRIKDFNECLSKFERKYLPKIDSAKTNFKIFDYISDFIGIRVVCVYLEDINLVRKELKRYFREIEITNKTIELEKTDDKFGYRSLHLDLILNSKCSKLPEFKKYKNIKFELQIRTILQDAWSVLDHKIKYKKSIPHNLKRRINRLSALFEVADEEFFRINQEITAEEKNVNERLNKKSSIDKDKPLDVFRFLFIALKYFPGYDFIEYKVDGFVQEILEMKNNFTESELNDALQKNLGFAEQVAENEKKSLNPYTKIRYCLLLFDQVLFSKILTDYQKNTLIEIQKKT